MKKHIKLIVISLMLCIITLCGCSKQEQNTEQPVNDTTETVETESDIKDKNKDTDKTEKDNKDKDKTDKDTTETYVSIDDLENINVELEDVANVELEEAPQTSGKVVDTYFDFSIYEFSDDNNNSAQLFDGDYEKYMFELNNYIIELVHVKLNRIVRYLNDETYIEKYGVTIENDLQDIEILLRGLDAKNAVIISYFTHDTDLLTMWNTFYQEMVLVRSQLESVDKTNCNELDLSNLGSAATSLSSLLGSRTVGYGYITADDVPDIEETSETMETTETTDLGNEVTE